ncbi:MAG: hypothetical protein ABSF48_09085, partial [Thermodesulfobacteriota bacterium]
MSLYSDLNQMQEKVSSGKNFNSPSDNPVAMVQLLQLDNTSSQYQQYVTNGQSANTNLTLEEQALSTSTTTLQSIRDLVVQANSGANSTSDLKDIATQIKIPLWLIVWGPVLVRCLWFFALYGGFLPCRFHPSAQKRTPII